MLFWSFFVVIRIHNEVLIFNFVIRKVKIQEAPLNWITDTIINWLLWSNLSRLTSPKFLFRNWSTFKFIHVLLSVGYCIQFLSALSDQIKLVVDD